jgi:hypothetical protein
MMLVRHRLDKRRRMMLLAMPAVPEASVYWQNKSD